jgi:hypothetical protein
MKRLLVNVMSALLLPALTAVADQTVAQIARRVDNLLATELAVSPGELAPSTSDDTYLRRVYLDLTGDIPTPEEITAFVLDPAADKRDRIVRTLLDKPQYGQNWARYWRDVILYRRIEERAVLVSNPLVTKLTKDLNDNKPWSEIASEFITAEGDVQNNGATAVIMAQEGRTEETTAEMARIFLGIQIQCAQCHDHPWDSWKREQFHELAAFFPRLGVRPVLTPTRRSFMVYSSDQPERRRMMMAADKPRAEAEHYMADLEKPEERGTRTQPKFFLTGATLPFGTTDADRRGQLAAWFTENQWFATAAVNRLWAELVGAGFYSPVDDIGPDREAVAPETVKMLSNQFARNGYDLKWLLRVICATEAYQREARPRSETGKPNFAANVAQPLRGDQLFNALLTALDFDEPTRGAIGGRGEFKAYGGQATPRVLFNATFGFDPSNDRESVSASIPQSLALMNTAQINQAIISSKSLPQRLMTRFGEDDDAIVEELYLRCLSREPTAAERTAALDYLAYIPLRKEAVEDLTWALVNCSEFSHRR